MRNTFDTEPHGWGSLKRYILVPLALVAAYISWAWFYDVLPQFGAPVDTLISLTTLWLLPVGPIVFISLALATVAAVRKRGLTLARSFDLVPSATPRGLAAGALWVATILSAYFFVAFFNMNWWMPIGIDAPVPPPGLPAVIVLVPGLLMAGLLVYLLVSVLRGVHGAAAGDVVIGREVVAAYVVTLVGMIPPAALSCLALMLNVGWY